MNSRTKPLLAVALLLALAALAWFSPRTHAQNEPSTREVMKLKLAYAQNVLDRKSTRLNSSH